MTSTLEMTNKADGSLPAAKVVEAEITKVLAQLFVLKAMTKEDDVKIVVEGIRHNLCELRAYLGEHFAFKQ